jgi:endo-alpha-1,4-polygalactosaminidase (GH114 family)
MAEKKLSKRIILSVAATARNPKNRLHVISRNGKWVVKKEGARRVFGIYPTKNEAIEIATARVKAGKTKDAIVHDLMGQPTQKIV